jgi:hypothetical protein
MFKKQISEPVEAALMKAIPTMWDDILTVYRNSLAKDEDVYLSKARSRSTLPMMHTSVINSIRL